MRINSISNSSFKGYDARPIRGFIMGVNYGGIASEMKQIGEKEGFKIYSIMENYKSKEPYISTMELPGQDNRFFWVQDLWTIINDKLLFKKFSNRTRTICNFFGLKYDFTQYVARSVKNDELLERSNINIFDLDQIEELLRYSGAVDKSKRETHIPGGNIYIVKGDTGNEVIVGASELTKYSEDEIMGMYNAKKVTVIPQTDFHIDLFLRPLDNKRILVSDDKLSIRVMSDALEKLEQGKQNPTTQEVIYRLKEKLNKFIVSTRRNEKPDSDSAADILTSAGYAVIKVPGNVYNYKNHFMVGEDTLYYDCNYINAQVFKNGDGDLVYITNKSCMDKDMGIDEEVSKRIGYSFENEFIKSISRYVKPEHIYFIEGNNNYVARRMLGEYLGGIHCASLEVPKE